MLNMLNIGIIISHLSIVSKIIPKTIILYFVLKNFFRKKIMPKIMERKMIPSIAIIITSSETEKCFPIHATFKAPRDPEPIAIVIKENVGERNSTLELT